MRQYLERVPHSKRVWRLETHLKEDGILSESEQEEEIGSESEESEELDLSGLEAETEESEESVDSTDSDELEVGQDWYGLIEI